MVSIVTFSLLLSLRKANILLGKTKAIASMRSINVFKILFNYKMQSAMISH